MRPIIALALKDLRVLPRNRGGVLLHLHLADHRHGDVRLSRSAAPATATQGKVKIAIVDDDGTDGSRAFIARLEESFEVTTMTARRCRESAVRRGQRTGSS